MNRLPALEWQQGNKLEIKVQGKKEKPKAQRRREKNPPKGWQPERQ